MHVQLNGSTKWYGLVFAVYNLCQFWSAIIMGYCFSLKPMCEPALPDPCTIGQSAACRKKLLIATSVFLLCGIPLFWVRR